MKKINLLLSLIISGTAAFTLSSCNSGTSAPTTANLTQNWATSMQQQGNSCATIGVKVDNQSNTYTVGSCTDSVGAQISYLTKYDNKGNELFQKIQTMNNSQWQYAQVTGLALDKNKNSNVYVASYVNVDDIVITPNYTEPEVDGSVYKYDSDGRELWHATFGNNDYQTKILGIATDNDGNPIAVGSMMKRDTTLSDTSPYFIAKLDKTTGKQIFFSAQGSINGRSEAQSVVVNESNSIFVAGFTTAPFSTETQRQVPEYFVAKYNESNAQWLQQESTTNRSGQIINSQINIDTDGVNVYVNGAVQGDLFSSAIESEEYFVAKYSPQGVRTWGIQGGGGQGNNYEFQTLSIDKINGIIYTTSGQIVGSTNNYATVVTTFSTANGSVLWSQVLNNGGNGFTTTSMSSFFSNGLLYLAGYSTSPVFGIDPSISKQGGFVSQFTVNK